MFDFETLLPLILQILPDIINIVIVLRVYLVLAGKILGIVKNNDDTKVLVDRLLKENYELKKQMNELLTKIDHVERE